VSPTGEEYPETTAGDVQRAALLFSRELCLPRYDFANLAAARTAWRDAVARTRDLCARVDWRDPYPENERFWLGDSLALAQRLAAVDARRNTIVEDDDGLLRIVGDRSDPLTTWHDVRSFLLARRAARTDAAGYRYPVSTVGDVIQLAQIFDEDLRRVAGVMPGGRPQPTWAATVRQWREESNRVAKLTNGRGRDEMYPESEGFWRAIRRLAIRLSATLEGLRVGDSKLRAWPERSS